MAISVALSEAQAHLPELLDRVDRGEEIVIEREGARLQCWWRWLPRKCRCQGGSSGKTFSELLISRLILTIR